MKDPRAGSIARDAYLLIVLKGDGSPLVPEIRRQFNCLQLTGDFCK